MKNVRTMVRSIPFLTAPGLLWFLGILVQVSGLQAQGRVTVEWSDGRWEGISAQWEVPGLKMALRKAADTDIPVGGLRTPFLVLGPMVPRGGVAMEGAWNTMTPSSGVWTQNPGWMMGDLPQKWKGGGLFLGGREAPGGVYVHRGGDGWKGGAYVWGPVYIHSEPVSFFAGAEGTWEAAEDYHLVPYKGSPDPGDRSLGARLGMRWMGKPLQVQVWTWSSGGLVQNPAGSGAVLIGLARKGWSAGLMTLGSLGRRDGRLAALGGRLSKAFPLGDLSAEGLWEWTAPGPAWEMEIRGALADTGWKVWFEGLGKENPRTGRSVAGKAGVEAGAEFLKGLLRVKIAEEVYSGLLFRLQRSELQAGALRLFEEGKWAGEAAGKFQSEFWSASGKVRWQFPSGGMPTGWELSLRYTY